MNITTGILLTIVGLGIIGFWVLHIIKGGLTQGIRTLESGGYIAFHISAELLTGILCALSGITLALSLEWPPPVALLASGMLLYTSINSLAWREVKNNPKLSLLFVIPALIAIFSIIYLLADSAQ